MELRYAFSEEDAKKLLYGLIAFEVFLTLVFFGDIFFGIPIKVVSSFFHLEKEGNFPTWFSSAQLFLVGIIFLLAARRVEPICPPSPFFLCLLGLVFFFLALDEASSIHENVTRLLKSIEWVPRFRGDHGIWIPIYFAMGLIFFVATFGEFKAMWVYFRRETSIMGMGSLIFLSGGVGLEIISYQYLREGTTPLLYELEVGIEEFLEMLGVSLILYGALLFSQTKP